MPKTTSRKRSLLSWFFGILAIILAIAAVLSEPNIRQIIKDHNLQSSVGTYIQEFNIEPQDTNAYISTAGIALKEGENGYESQRRVESDYVITKDEFNAVGVRWHETKPEGTEITLSIRIGHGEEWISWREVLESEDMKVRDDPEAKVSDLIFVPSGDRVQIAVDLSTEDSSVTPRLEDIRLDFLNTKEGPTAAALAGSSISAQAQTSGVPYVIARPGWGADESWMDWPVEHQPVEQIVVHHTAGSNGGNDPAAVVRGIYAYHTLTLDWGDIGYNFLIDSQGNIYEGRAGGLDAVAGHTYGFNDGSIGIALLGNYETFGATIEAETALVNLVGYLTANFDLEPTFYKNFQGVGAFTMSAHRDFTSTVCPGAYQYSRFDLMRGAASIARNSYLSNEYKGAFAGAINTTVTPTQGSNARISIKNIGQTTWTNSGSSAVILRTTEPEGHASPLFTNGWLNQSEPDQMNEASVPPGAFASFDIPLAAAPIGDTSDRLMLYLKNGGPVANTAFTLTRSSRPQYAGEVIGLPPVINVEGGTRTEIDVNIKNTGTETWYNSGANFAALNLTMPVGRTSAMREADWPTYYRPTVMDTAVVPPGAIGNFKFNLKVPSQSGDYIEWMQPVIENVNFIPGTQFQLHLNVGNALQAKINERPLKLFAGPNEQIPVTINVTNNSSIAWQPSGSGFVALEGVGLGGGSVLQSGAWLSSIRPATVPYAVQPGKTVPLTFNITAPAGYGVYEETYHLVSDGQGPIDGSTFKINLEVRGGGYAQVPKQPDALYLTTGSTGRFEVKIQNLGSSTWRAAAGSDFVGVTTNKYVGHTSDFATASWNANNSPTQLEPAIVAPNQTATLSIEIAAGASPNNSTEHFVLIDNSGTPIQGTEFSITRIVSGGSASVPGGALGPNIRVGIYNNPNTIVVAGDGSYTVKNTAGATLGTSSGGATTILWTGAGFSLSGAVSGFSAQSIRVEPVGGTILELPNYEDRPAWNPSLNDNRFRGIIEVKQSTADGQIYAINELPLEHYVYGIAEASNGDYPQYLQSLMTAVRTYAEYQRSIGGKHPQHGFDVDNKFDQVYKGYGFELRGSDIVAAAQATQGKFVTYNNKVEVTPYFSQSDGRTRSFAEAFGGAEKPWLVSVVVSEDNGKALSGHGVGMSASAARARAAAGWNADQILKSFYTGVAIQKLY